MTSRQFIRNLFESEAASPQQQREVVEQIGGLCDDLGVLTGACRERNLDAFLADLLRDAPRAFPEQLHGIALGRVRRDPPLDHIFEHAQEGEPLSTALRLVAEAGDRAEVAGGACGSRLHQQGVTIAVCGSADELQRMA